MEEGRRGRGEGGRKEREEEKEKEKKKENEKKKKEKGKEREGERFAPAPIAATILTARARALVGMTRGTRRKQGDGIAIGCRDWFYGRPGDRSGNNFEKSELNDLKRDFENYF